MKFAKSAHQDIAIKVTLTFIAFGFIWVILGDWIVYKYIDDPQVLTRIQNYKGGVFITLTAILIYYSTRNYLYQVIQAKKALWTSEEETRLMMNNVYDYAILKIDKAGEIVWCNPSAVEMFGLDGSCPSSIHSLAVDSKDIARLLNSKEKPAITENLLMIKSNGQKIWAEVSLNEIIDESKQSHGMVVVIKDITRALKIQEKLLSKNKEMSMFLYKAAHDLKGPLASILGITGLAKMEWKDINKNCDIDYLSLIDKQAKKLNRILDELSLIGEVQSLPGSNGEIDLEVITRKLWDSFISAEESKSRMKLKTNVRFSSKIKLPESTLQVVISEILQNAVQFRKRNEDLIVKFEAILRGEKLKLIISDNGLGIPNKNQSRIFEMFYRGHQESKGNGLGLYLTKVAVETLNGEIEVFSEEGKGTTLSVEVPLSGIVN